MEQRSYTVGNTVEVTHALPGAANNMYYMLAPHNGHPRRGRWKLTKIMEHRSTELETCKRWNMHC